MILVDEAFFIMCYMTKLRFLCTGIKILEEFANVDCTFGMTPDELKSKISLCDAIIIRSGTKVGHDS